MRFAPCYPIVDSAAWVQRLVLLGVKLVQLRIKDQPMEYVRAEIGAARQHCACAGACLVVNDYWECALEQRCPFVHLGQTDLNTADILALRAAGIGLGISTHDYAELDRALSFSPDYVALGPIYPTTLKQMPWAAQGLERISEWKAIIGDRPLVAIGGLTVERLPGVFKAGADSAAVVSDIIRHSAAQLRAREWLAACDKYAHG